MAEYNPRIEEKLAKLRLMYRGDDDVTMLDNFEKRLRTTIKNSGIHEMEPVIEIVESGYKVIEGIEFLLTTEKNMPQEERRALFEKRDCYQFWIDRLSGRFDDEREKNIEKFLDDRIKKYGDDGGDNSS